MISLERWSPTQGSWCSYTLLAIDQLDVLGEMAPVAWDRDIAGQHDLPMNPAPRLYLDTTGIGWPRDLSRGDPAYIIFGHFGGQWTAIAVWFRERWSVFRRTTAREEIFEFVRRATR